ncbi:MAG: hypothetical protein JSV12_05155 [Candidatus Bathyarchaeota archaeon]|nr:MAG: hypothetical protein JSV12_05155 [Candidatus Bathyarchaeota archaeon]
MKEESGLMAIFGLVEFILIVAVLIFLGIMYWMGKRNLAVGFIFLIIGSAYFLYVGIIFLLNLYVNIGNGVISLSDFSNILTFIPFLAVSLLMRAYL